MLSKHLPQIYVEIPSSAISQENYTIFFYFAVSKQANHSSRELRFFFLFVFGTHRGHLDPGSDWTAHLPILFFFFFKCHSFESDKHVAGFLPPDGSTHWLHTVFGADTHSPD